MLRDSEDHHNRPPHQIMLMPKFKEILLLQVLLNQFVGCSIKQSYKNWNWISNWFKKTVFIRNQLCALLSCSNTSKLLCHICQLLKMFILTWYNKMIKTKRNIVTLKGSERLSYLIDSDHNWQLFNYVWHLIMCSMLNTMIISYNWIKCWNVPITSEFSATYFQIL